MVEKTKKNKNNVRYEFIGRCLYFPLEKILCIGDLHLGYEEMMHEKGVLFPLRQMEDTKKELIRVFEFLKKTDREVERMLSDLKITGKHTLQH